MTVRGALLGLAIAASSAAAAPAPSGRAERIEYRDPSAAPSRGPANALVTIEVFFVPGPPYMPSAPLRLLQQLQERHPARVRLIYRILKGGTAAQVPSAALEAHAQGKFFELMEKLGNQRGMLRKEDLLELARKVGLDPERVARAIELGRYSDALEANQRRLERLHGGTLPVVMFNARSPQFVLSQANPADLDREYEAAYDRALDKLDRGFAVSELPAAFEDEAVLGNRPVQDDRPAGRSVDGEDPEDPDLAPPLAVPPIPLDGLPSFSKPGIDAEVSILVLCRPNAPSCNNLLRAIEPESRLYPDEVRVVWAPWFDLGRSDAAELALLGDAALCAEVVGSHQGELTESSGWVWVKEPYETYAQTARRQGKKLTADQLIDAVAARLDVDRRALSACRARMAGRSLSWIARAQRSGVPRGDSAIVIGGRIYSELIHQKRIRKLVEAELAPGVLGSLPRWRR